MYKNFQNFMVQTIRYFFLFLQLSVIFFIYFLKLFICMKQFIWNRYLEKWFGTKTEYWQKLKKSLLITKSRKTQECSNLEKVKIRYSWPFLYVYTKMQFVRYISEILVSSVNLIYYQPDKYFDFHRSIILLFHAELK